MKNAIYYLLLFLLGSFFSCTSDNSKSTKPDEILTSNLALTEAQIRAELNIPDNAQRVVILSHAAHMDWDWLNPFIYNANLTKPAYDNTYFYPTYPNRGPGDSILTRASNNLLDTSYYYSVCEMGFLETFSENRPNKFAQMKNSNRVRIVGGGITSPDNLLPNGEGFLRNFLVADNWLDQVGIPWSNQVWIPDDFGHDPQLPVMLQALDAQGVGFARIPGGCVGQPQYIAAPQTKDVLLDTVSGGVDFLWTASDNSSSIAHWLQSHYNQGADIGTPGGADYNSPEDAAKCDKSVYPDSAVAHIQAYINTNGPVSPSPYIYVHVSDDFMLPYQTIVKYANSWNTDSNGYAKTGVYAVVATFDHYIKLVSNYKANLKVRSYNPLAATTNFNPFLPNPYWMGYYASRPELKTLHNDAVRTLMAAETYQVIANTLLSTTASEKQNQIENLLNVWDTLAPSTHHDYITGTAVNDVYNYEQLPLLKVALDLGDTLQSQFVQSIVDKLPAGNNDIAVFNPLGVDNQGIISYQPTPNTTQFLNVSAPSLGYKLNNLTSAQQGDGSLKTGVDASGNIVFTNTKLSATFDANTGDLLSVIDQGSKTNILSGTGNEIVLFYDTGNIYRFGYENENCTFKQMPTPWTIVSVTLDTLNALQKAITVQKTTVIAGESKKFTIKYSLRQNESILRISTTGSLPAAYTAMVKFPLSNPIDLITAGTPYHWNTMTPATYGNTTDFNATMWATHDFVIPTTANGNPLAAIYHRSTPAWASDPQSNNLYGVILRSGYLYSCQNWGAQGTDLDAHTQEYALRVPSGLSAPATGQPLREARQFNTPMIAVPVPTSGGGNLPASYSLASTSGNTMITTAKWCYADPGALILRTYQPTNTTISCTLNVNPQVANCNAVSALEKPIEFATVAPSCSGSATQYQLNLPRAVATFKLD